MCWPHLSNGKCQLFKQSEGWFSMFASDKDSYVHDAHMAKRRLCKRGEKSRK